MMQNVTKFALLAASGLSLLSTVLQLGQHCSRLSGTCQVAVPCIVMLCSCSTSHHHHDDVFHHQRQGPAIHAYNSILPGVMLVEQFCK